MCQRGNLQKAAQVRGRHACRKRCGMRARGDPVSVQFHASTAPLLAARMTHFLPASKARGSMDHKVLFIEKEGLLQLRNVSL